MRMGSIREYGRVTARSKLGKVDIMHKYRAQNVMQTAATKDLHYSIQKMGTPDAPIPLFAYIGKVVIPINSHNSKLAISLDCVTTLQRKPQNYISRASVSMFQ